MLTSKQRAQLRALANPIDTIMQVGKGGVTENLITTVSDALEARELIKLRVLENSDYTPGEAQADRAGEITDGAHRHLWGKLLAPPQRPSLRRTPAPGGSRRGSAFYPSRGSSSPQDP